MVKRVVGFFLVLGAVVLVALLAGVGAEVLMQAPGTYTTG